MIILAVGRLKSPYKELAEDFLKRMDGFVKVIEIRESDKFRETREVIRRLRKLEGKKVLCDVEGRLIDFEYLKKLPEDTIFIIGGPDGFTKEIEGYIDEKISFSKLTFNHQLFRILLLEQIYRIYSNRKGLPYIRH